MICPLCKQEMHETTDSVWHVCISCRVYFYPKIKDREEDTEYYSAYQFRGETYSVEEFERRCKLKAFW